VEIRVWDKKGIVENILSSIILPRMVRIKQKFDTSTLYNIAQETKKEINKAGCTDKIQAGMNIAVAVGSRGIADLDIITRQTIDVLKDFGANPFIIPAMGSHGGAEPAGQKKILESLGITEKTMGVRIDASMDVIKVDTLYDGREVFIAKAAATADGIVLINRVKPHTSFHGTYESGLVKMMAIGLGKQSGAASCHVQGFKKMAENVPLYGLSVLNNSPILFGIAIIENSAHKVSRIVAVPKERIEHDEPELLKEAKRKMASILFEDIDVLIVDEIGKNHSGDGMDPNVTGSYCTPYAYGPPRVSKYVVLDASEETHGNTLGIGMADFTTKRLFDKTDFDKIYPNSLTSKVPSVSKMPMVLNSDQLAIKAAIMTCDTDRYEELRLVRISNSSHVEEIWISENMLEEAKINPSIEISGEPLVFDFTALGELRR
jgi:hypothetical protein